MSKLLEAVEAHITRRQAPPPASTRLKMITEHQERNMTNSVCDVWRVTVRMGQDVVLPKNFPAKGLEQVLYDVRCGIADFVFGEYIEKLRAIMIRLYDTGDTEMAQEISAIIDDMRGCK